MSNQQIEIILERNSQDKDNPTRKVDRWLAWFGKDLLVDGSRDPEHDACRALVDMGITGKVAFRHKGSFHVSIVMDIARGAKVTVREDGTRFQLEKFQCFSRAGSIPKNCDEGSARYLPTRKAKRASTNPTSGGAL